MSAPPRQPRPWQPRPWQAWHHRTWTLANTSTAPVWLAMIVVPRATLTRRLVRAAVPLQAALGLGYVGLIGRGIALGGERVDFTDGESVARGMANPEGMLAGWMHYLAFDLFVGEWIHRTALEEGINARLALLLTWWAGPAGLTCFLWQRRRARRLAA